jgi:hypothetical protein
MANDGSSLRIEAVPAVFNPATGQLPSPEALAAYAAIDPSYPAFLREAFKAELKRNYQYQLIALIAGWSFGTLLLSGSVLLAYANTLIGANMIGLATRMLTKGATRRG